MNVDQATNEAIRLVSEGARMSANLISFIFSKVADAVENDKENTVIDGKTREGQQKIKNLMRKHKDGIESLEGNLTKDQLKDYQKELKRLGVDFSVVKNEKDNYSFFFSGSQASVIEKGLNNVLEKKNRVINNEKVKSAELDLNAEKNNFTDKEINEVEKVHREPSKNAKELSDKENILLNKMETLNNTEKEVQEKLNEIDELKNNKQGKEVKTSLKEIESKDSSKKILNNKLSELNEKELDLFEKKMEYENLATSPIFEERKTYEKADEFKKLQKSFSKETVDKINNLDKDIRDLNNFSEISDGKKLNANEILRETKKHSVDRKKQQTKELKNKKVKTFSMENVQKKDKEIKKQTLNKEKQHKHEQSL